jgi:hypothetical protein
MIWFWQHTVIEPDPGQMRQQLERMQPWDVPVCFIGRTPLQSILVDYTGLENFGLHLAEFSDEMRTLYELMLRGFRRGIEIACQTPPTYFWCLENFTAEALGPARYAEFLLPVYEECFPAARQAGKIVGVHYDGQTKVIRDLFQRAPVDAIESFTLPPEGDQTMAEARKAWPDKLIWANINVGMYGKSTDVLQAYVCDMIRDGAPDGRRLALEVSEDLPANWAAALPVVQTAIAEGAVS